MPRLSAALLWVAGCALFTTARGDVGCDGARVLASSAHAYQRLDSLHDTAKYVVRVPGAPQHLETTEFGFDRQRVAYLRMPGLYVMQVQGKRLVLAADSADSTRRVLDRDVLDELQAAVDAAFEGHGPPLVPVPLLLRAARSQVDGLQGFRSRLLHTLTLKSCRHTRAPDQQPLLEVMLEADNGRIQARFAADSYLLLGYRAEISTGAESPPIVAEVSFDPHPGSPPPLLDVSESAEQVRHFSELTAARSSAPAEPLRASGLLMADGRPLDLSAFAGDITILDFWARWCAPCRLTLPTVARVADWAGAQKLPVHVVLVNTAEGFGSADAARPEVQSFLQALHISLPSALDLDGSFQARFGGGLPLTVVISAKGQVVARHGGYDAALEEWLRRQINEQLGRTGE